MLGLCIVSLVVATAPITPLHTYCGVHSGISVTLDLPDGVDAGHVVLLDHENQILAEPAVLSSGSHDLLKDLPFIKEMKQAAWLQLVVRGTPLGSPLVIQPMTSRQIPIVEQATRSDGKTAYTRIIGWRDEAEEDGIDTPLISGWRVYVDEDIIIETSEGAIHIALRPDIAPNTAWNFRTLSAQGFYHKTTFHRIVPMTSKGFPFVIQGGDPTGTGSGGPGYWLPMERSSLQHDVGVVSMARADDPDSAGSQFFICLSREGTSRLDGQYCAFGETTAGLDVIRAIAATPLQDPSLGRPVTPPTINTIRLVPAAPRYPSR